VAQQLCITESFIGLHIVDDVVKHIHPSQSLLMSIWVEALWKIDIRMVLSAIFEG